LTPTLTVTLVIVVVSPVSRKTPVEEVFVRFTVRVEAALIALPPAS
jgi:hypothetical protein